MDAMIFLNQGQTLKTTPEMVHWVETMLPADVHPERAQSFLLSRLALQEALQTLLARKIAPTELGLVHHHALHSFPDCFATLSHTKDAAVAWVRKQRGHGIDLERLDRPLKESIWERIHHPDDDKNLTRLELWCLKEAAFKALFNGQHIHGPVAFKDIQFKKDGHWQWRSVSGHYLTSIEDGQWQVARAWFN
jgi:4'-phosphopantetheinyl transferase EntD